MFLLSVVVIRSHRRGRGLVERRGVGAVLYSLRAGEPYETAFHERDAATALEALRPKITPPARLIPLPYSSPSCERCEVHAPAA